ncbi:MAG: histidine--tRNA ligase [Gammaproteobacteria bacterium]|nr:histidine--tRNA ligase [Gammaproteobacteria bacterium]
MSKAIQAVRGMNDLLPDVVERWQQIEIAAREVLQAYGYREIRLPVVEKSELFARAVGDTTDIVEKEMYSFEDRSGEHLTLRPEGTAGCVRAGIENGFLHNQIQRLWYAGPMFRHERPQKGRYRQFHQIGVETFGIESPDLDAELLLMCARLWRALGLTDIKLELNSLGTQECRATYRRVLLGYFDARRDRLDEDSLRRLDKNPLRILDSKNPAMQELVAAAPSLLDHLDEASRAHFERLQEYLQAAGVEFAINPRLVRGLDYYTRTVFEWTTAKLGAQAAVCAGGRYDGLVEQLGGKPTFAAGFAMGMERLVELLLQRGDAYQAAKPQVYLAMLGAPAEKHGLVLAEQLRDAGLRIECNNGGGSLKTQLKRADKSGARLALLLGEAEMNNASITIKDLRAGDTQQSVAQTALTDLLKLKFAMGNRS